MPLQTYTGVGEVLPTAPDLLQRSGHILRTLRNLSDGDHRLQLVPDLLDMFLRSEANDGEDQNDENEEGLELVLRNVLVKDACMFEGDWRSNSLICNTSRALTIEDCALRVSTVQWINNSLAALLIAKLDYNGKNWQPFY